MRLCILFILVSGVALAAEPSPYHFVNYELSSGLQHNTGAETQVIFTEEVRIQNATWVRLFFDRNIQLSDAGQQSKSILRITSLEDGHTQTFNASTIEQWNYSSAYFNGAAVRLELISDVGADQSSFEVNRVMAGEPTIPPKSICGPDDDRLLSSDARSARLFPVGCTAWLINDAHQCFLTAGHCFTGDVNQVAQFNVPLSDELGNVNHPGPEDQYFMDNSSLQFTQTVIGDDWGYFGTLRNTETGMTAAEAAGSTYTLGTPPLSSSGETIRITGYGTVDGTQGTPQTWSQVQTTHTGPLVSVSGSVLTYSVDTTGGDSGSAVLDETTGESIGIHTNAGCTDTGGANSATSLINAGLQAALASPLGVCLNGPPPLTVLTMITNASDPVDPAGGQPIEITITDYDALPVTPASAALFVDHGEGFSSYPMVNSSGANWTASLPSMSCGQEVRYRVDVVPLEGGTVRLPKSSFNPVDVQYVRTLGVSFDGTFSDDMETDTGWTVTDDPGLTDGSWERGTPGFGSRNDPGFDADGSGQAFLTHAAEGNTDVDGGATRLTSPAMNASAPNSTITYWRWFSVGGTADDDFLVEVSADDGNNWTTLETVPTPGGSSWVQRAFKVSKFVNNTNQFRIRFTASDTGAGSIVEAGVDGVKLYNNFSGIQCDPTLFRDGFEQP